MYTINDELLHVIKYDQTWCKYNVSYINNITNTSCFNCSFNNARLAKYILFTITTCHYKLQFSFTQSAHDSGTQINNQHNDKVPLIKKYIAALKNYYNL